MPAKISQRPGKGFSGLVFPDEMSDIFFITLQEQPLTHASLRYPTFATSLTGYVTSEIAEDEVLGTRLLQEYFMLQAL